MAQLKIGDKITFTKQNKGTEYEIIVKIDKDGIPITNKGRKLIQNI